MELTKRVAGLTVLLIDMQYGFLGHSEDRKIIPHQIAILKFCKQTNTPTILIEYGAGFLGKTICPLLSIAEKIPAYRYVQKSQDCAFSAPMLEDLLKEFETSKILLMGVRADLCIYKTAQQAIMRGYEVLTSSNLISGYKFNEEKIIDWYQKNTTYRSEEACQ